MALVHEFLDDGPALLVVLRAGQGRIYGVGAEVAVVTAGALAGVEDRGEPQAVDAHLLVVIQHLDRRLDGAFRRAAGDGDFPNDQGFHPIGAHEAVTRILHDHLGIVHDFRNEGGVVDVGCRLFRR